MIRGDVIGSVIAISLINRSVAVLVSGAIEKAHVLGGSIAGQSPIRSAIGGVIEMRFQLELIAAATRLCS